MKTIPAVLAILILFEGLRADEAEVVSEPVASGHPTPPTPAPEFKPVRNHIVAYGLLALSTGTTFWVAEKLDGESAQFSPVHIWGGFVLSPAAGQLYAASPHEAAAGIAIRTAGMLLTPGADCDFPMGGKCDVRFVLGVLMLYGGMVYSIADTYYAVDRANERARKKFESRMSLSPMLHPVRDGRDVTRWAPGLALSATF